MTGECVGVLPSRNAKVSTVAFSPDGQRLFVSGSSGSIEVWDPDGQELILTLHGHEAAVYCVALSPDGRTLASASIDGTVKLWDAEVAGKDAANSFPLRP